MQEQIGRNKENNRKELKLLFSPRIATGFLMLLAMIFYVIAIFCLFFPVFKEQTTSERVYVFGMGGFGGAIILCYVLIATTIVLTILSVNEMGWKAHIAKYIIMIVINVVCAMAAMILMFSYDLHLTLSTDVTASFDMTFAADLASFGIVAESLLFAASAILLLLYAKGKLSVQTIFNLGRSKRTRNFPFTYDIFLKLCGAASSKNMPKDKQMMEVMIACALLSKDGQKFLNETLDAIDKNRLKK